MNELLRFERVLWQRGLTHVAGVDEVGIGPLAGPVVAAAVILPMDLCLGGIRDSKKLIARQREILSKEIYHTAWAVGIGMADLQEIDRLNIYQAGLLAMNRAVKQLPLDPQFVLVDARCIPDISWPQRGIIRGDAKSQSIAAASIVAKVHRDALMDAFDRQFPQYGFIRHKGYPTTEHRRALAEYGPCPIHRRSFHGVAEFYG
jgi:ribonuclease HII